MVKARRPRQSGSIIHRPNGRIEARWRDPLTGATRSAYVTTEAEARAVLVQLAAGSYVPQRKRTKPAAPAAPAPPPVLTLADFSEQYLRHCAVMRVHPDTIRRTYRPLLRCFTVSIGHNPLAEITPGLVSEALADLERRGYAPGTIARAWRLLRSCCALAEEWDLVKRNPVRGRGPSAPPRKVLDISPERAIAILVAVRGTVAEGPATLGLLYGLRFGEVMGLRWEHVSDHTLRICAQLDHGGAYKPWTKGKKERTIPLIPPIVDVLRRQRVAQATARLAAGSSYTVSGFLWTNWSGAVLSRGGVRNPFLAALEAAGLPRTNFHDLRHMTATLLRRLGVPEEVRRAIIGHESAEVHRAYQHVSVEDTRDALERLAAVLRG